MPYRDKARAQANARDRYKKKMAINPAFAKEKSRKQRYGISPAQYEEMLQQQNGVCAVCEQPPLADSSLHVDHNHETGKVRELLCLNCNNAIGHAQESADMLRKLARYVEKHK